MAREQSDIRMQQVRDGDLQVQRSIEMDGRDERPLGDLLKQLTADTGELMRQEVALVKAEVRQAGVTLARDASKIGIALGLALAGALALTAFLIAGLGDILNHNYWLSSLIVGAVFLIVGAVLVKNATSDIKRRGLAPTQTMKTLRDDAAWAGREAREVKRELTT